MKYGIIKVLPEYYWAQDIGIPEIISANKDGLTIIPCGECAGLIDDNTGTLFDTEEECKKRLEEVLRKTTDYLEKNYNLGEEFLYIPFVNFPYAKIIKCNWMGCDCEESECERKCNAINIVSFKAIKFK